MTSSQQTSRALRQYRICEEALSQEYGLSPSPDIQTLYLSLLNDHSAREVRR